MSSAGTSRSPVARLLAQPNDSAVKKAENEMLKKKEKKKKRKKKKKKKKTQLTAGEPIKKT